MMQFSTDYLASPEVVKISESENHGVRSLSLTRMAIGYVFRGHKFLHSDDRCVQIDEGSLFLLDAGLHYEENVVGATGQFEQVLFYLTPHTLQQVIMGLNTNYGATYTARHSCAHCRAANFAAMPASASLADFFVGLHRSFRHAGFQHNDICQRIKLNELIYLVLSGEECCLRTKLLAGADTAVEQFANVVYQNLFNDLSIEELAELTHRSLTSFKKEFRRRFDMSPHRWFVAQRLSRARILLLSTSMTISEVGVECGFSNISHFIKLFKSRFHATPASFRLHHSSSCPPQGA